MPGEKTLVKDSEKQTPSKLAPFSRTVSHERYPEPEAILDASCIMEQMDRGEGMGVDDEKTYHRTER